MRGAAIPQDRRRIIASLRDYVEQLREEGMEGVPASARAPAATAETSKPAARSVAAAGASAPTELFYLYPGLAKTSDLTELLDFIGDCQRCKLPTRGTNLVFV